MYVVRNAGNLIPHAPNDQYETITTEPAALELGVIRYNMRDVVICGHSDCKAMNLLYGLRDKIHEHRGSPLEVWVKKHGTASVLKHEIFMRYPHEPLQFYAERPFMAFIDPDNRFNEVDKFSQVNCLQQLQNIHSYGFLQERIRNGFMRVHAMFFDIYSGDVFLYSRAKRRFMLIDESSLDHLIGDSTNVVLPQCHLDHHHTESCFHCDPSKAAEKNKKTSEH
jgi:carbonic anhydrase